MGVSRSDWLTRLRRGAGRHRPELEKRNLMGSVALIGHRIAHGGDLFSESTLITEEVMAQIREVSPLAPLHNYANLSGVEAAGRLFPGVQQVAVFDTSFHQTMAPQAYLYGLPYRYFEEPACAATVSTAPLTATCRRRRTRFSGSLPMTAAW